VIETDPTDLGLPPEATDPTYGCCSRKWNYQFAGPPNWPNIPGPRTARTARRRPDSQPGGGTSVGNGSTRRTAACRFANGHFGHLWPRVAFVTLSRREGHVQAVRP
jgi:hypothetical protein